MNKFTENDKKILLILNKLISEIFICKYIIIFKKEIENKININYYKNLYNNIVKSFYRIRNNHMNKFSIIFTINNYIVKVDHNMDYYKYTGYSYQLKELINDLIININNKDLIKENDKLYKLLSDKINQKIQYVIN